ncbi:prolyl-tRNA synthetase [Anaerobranca californiensis DSM 14826]|jgi:prolyl-tRNA synthetase|uniref:Proline--tRNA ligase n=1 Tax=Anaerobranca californiensis DSM 14826 TaxID=1120989 RepID=A0A1M6KFC9_9FIRM|nr:proline--tRNA ligase [Anaerobranca californiensis]SHJ57608.1 prolyl-tRNA synthetase [Anaerobranca californiensis DSM 14826]
MKTSKYFMPTLREVSSDAETISHQLMLRAGLIRKQAAGIYTYLPLGFKVLKKIENIVREEMERSGAIEILASALQNAELWQESHRWYEYGAEMFRLQDRHGRDFCLGPTHEEIFTDLVRNNISSYRQLPLNLFQIQTKYRDEKRPRFGVIRSREFIMKDAYSFDIDEEGLNKSYEEMYKAYRRIFDRCNLKYQVVEADTGNIGGSSSHEFMVISEVGEDSLIFCDNCGYSANVEKAQAVDRQFVAESIKKKEKVYTPNIKTIDKLAEFLSIESSKILKAVLYTDEKARTFMCLLPGDREVNEIKLKKLLGIKELNLASEEEIYKVTKCKPGFSGPVGINKEVFIVADNEVKTMTNFVVGANEEDYHIINVNLNEFNVNIYGDIKNAEEGDNCIKCGNKLSSSKGIEVGHIFKLGTKYSKLLKATYLDKNGKEQPMVMGCYGIGITRTLAAIIEQNNDEDGICWPKHLAPFEVAVIPVNIKDEEQANLAEKIYEQLKNHNIDVLLDDRDERVGVKFKDIDLIGIPLKIVIGKKISEGQVELKFRSGKETKLVNIGDIIEEVKNFYSLT